MGSLLGRRGTCDICRVLGFEFVGARISDACFFRWFGLRFYNGVSDWGLLYFDGSRAGSRVVSDELYGVMV